MWSFKNTMVRLVSRTFLIVLGCFIACLLPFFGDIMYALLANLCAAFWPHRQHRAKLKLLLSLAACHDSASPCTFQRENTQLHLLCGNKA